MALPSSLHSPAAVDFQVLSTLPMCPFSSPKGKWRGWRETKALRTASEHASISTAAAISCRSTILLHCWHCRQKASSNPLYVWGGHAHQPGSSSGPNTALASSCFPWLQAEAGELTISKQSPFGKAGAVGYLAPAGLALTWSVSSGCKRICTVVPLFRAAC